MPAEILAPDQSCVAPMPQLQRAPSPVARFGHAGWILASASSRDVEFVPLHLGEVGTLDPDQARVAIASRRVQITLVVEVRGPGRQLVGANLLDLAWLTVRRLLNEARQSVTGSRPPLGCRLPSSARGRAAGCLRSPIDVRENAEVQLWIFIKDFRSESASGPR